MDGLVLKGNKKNIIITSNKSNQLNSNHRIIPDSYPPSAQPDWVFFRLISNSYLHLLLHLLSPPSFISTMLAHRLLLGRRARLKEAMRLLPETSGFEVAR